MDTLKIKPMKRKKGEQPIGTLNGVYFYQSDVDYDLAEAARYLKTAKRFEKIASKRLNKTRGGYLSQAKQARRNAERMKKYADQKKARIGKWGTVDFVVGED